MILTVGAGVSEDGAIGGSVVVVGGSVGCGVFIGEAVKMDDRLPGEGGSAGCAVDGGGESVGIGLEGGPVVGIAVDGGLVDGGLVGAGVSSLFL